jgi:hypothetical protein
MTDDDQRRPLTPRSETVAAAKSLAGVMADYFIKK